MMYLKLWIFFFLSWTFDLNSSLQIWTSFSVDLHLHHPILDHSLTSPPSSWQRSPPGKLLARDHLRFSELARHNAWTGPSFIVTLLPQLDDEREERCYEDNEESCLNPTGTSSQLPWLRLGCGRGRGGRRVGVLVAAGARLCRVALGRAAEVAVAQVLAAQVVDAGKLLQLVEELGSAAVLPVAALTLCAWNKQRSDQIFNGNVENSNAWIDEWRNKGVSRIFLFTTYWIPRVPVTKPILSSLQMIQPLNFSLQLWMALALAKRWRDTICIQLSLQLCFLFNGLRTRTRRRLDNTNVQYFCTFTRKGNLGIVIMLLFT